MVRDVGLAEELAQEALVAALERWPETGVPDNPGAWLMTAAKNRAVDQLRQAKMAARKHEELGRDVDARQATGGRSGRSRKRWTTTSGDDLLRLDLRGLPPGALDRVARRADAAPARGPDDGRDRARVPRARADHRPAARAGQARARRRRACPSRVPRGDARCARGSPRCSRFSISSSTRATRPPRATTGCDRPCARTLSVSVASLRSSSRRSPRSTGSSR